MEINASTTVGNPLQGPEAAPKVDEIKRETDETTEQQTAPADENPDYSVSLSETSKQAITEFTAPPASSQAVEDGGLGEQDAARLAQQTAAQLAHTNFSIANQAMQKAMDLFA